MTVMASVNQGQWDVLADFKIRGTQVWLSEVGRRKFVELYENCKQETWKHPVIPIRNSQYSPKARSKLHNDARGLANAIEKR